MVLLLVQVAELQVSIKHAAHPHTLSAKRRTRERSLDVGASPLSSQNMAPRRPSLRIKSALTSAEAGDSYVMNWPCDLSNE